MDPKILYEDKELIVLDKPAGWVVNDAETVKDGNTIQRWLAENFNFEIAKDRVYRSGIVHRLDKDTSGVLVIAKTKNTFEKLQSKFKERTVKKTYLALLHGLLPEKEGEVRASVGRLPWNRRRFGVLPGGRDSLTRYSLVSKFKNPESDEKLSLVEFFPETGRTHQIRIHAKHLGHAIVADDFYAGRKTARKDKKWCPRLFLHAAEISFTHPSKGDLVKFKSSMPSDLQAALDSLEKLREKA